MHVVGGPVAGGGRVLVLVSASDRSVWLEAVDARTGKVAWKLPESFSEITPGVETTPLVHAGVVLALVPVGGAGSPYVRLEGVRVASGAVAWRSRSRSVVTDAPSSCPQPLGRNGFCVVAATAPGKPSALVALAPATGAGAAVVPGVERSMSTTPGLYQAYSTPSVLIGVRTPGGTVWGQPVSRLFGAGYDPNDGWDFDQSGAAWIGFVGKARHGTTVPLGGQNTIAVSQATGKRLWSDPGVFECGGQDILTGDWLCLLTGTATLTASGKVTTSKDASLTLEGFDPATGRITWRLPAGHIADLMRGDVAIGDAHHLLVSTPQARKLVVDLRNGATAAPAAGQAFWCGHANFFRIAPPKGVTTPQRVGSNLYAPCNASRQPLTALPGAPAVAAVDVGPMRVWAAPAGLEATRR